MPCYRCRRRQDDPVRGASPWKRGVIAAEQVLVCPDCQQVHDWVADLDRCPQCSSTALIRVLGVTNCKACGAEDVAPVSGTAKAAATENDQAALADEVSRALDRLHDT